MARFDLRYDVAEIAKPDLREFGRRAHREALHVLAEEVLRAVKAPTSAWVDDTGRSRAAMVASVRDDFVGLSNPFRYAAIVEARYGRVATTITEQWRTIRENTQRRLERSFRRGQ